MDIWDALKLMWRRWYVSIPMILLTLGAAAWTLMTVEPHHTSDGHVMLLPPSTELPPADGEEQVVNPWTTESLGAAVITRLNNNSLREQLADEGHGAEWEAGRDPQFGSVVFIQTTSTSPADAQDTLQRLLHVVEIEVLQQQQPYQLPPGAQVTTLRLDEGENIAIARGNQARALVVVFGIGGIFTLVATVSTDVLLRARLRRRVTASGSVADDGIDDASPAALLPAATGNGHRPAPAPEPVVSDGSAPVGETQPPIAIKYRPMQAAKPDAEPAPAARQDLEDATVVLPLSRLSWERKSRSERGGDDSADRPDEAGRG